MNDAKLLVLDEPCAGLDPGGNAIASGEISNTLTSESLSELFNADVTLDKEDSRYYARIKPTKERIF